MQVNILEAKNRLSQLVKAAQAGEDVVIANRGEPVARLVPAGPAPQARTNAGSAPAILDWLKRHKLPAYARRTADEMIPPSTRNGTLGIDLSRFLSRDLSRRRPPALG